MKDHGYRVFLDTESLRAGQFDEELYRVIKRAKDVVVILPKNGLDRCSNKDDWLRLEIEHAVACQKNIVPVFLKGFEFPEALPPSLEFLRTQQGIEPAMKFYDAFIEQLQKMLKSKPFRSRVLRALILPVAVLLAVFVGSALSQRNDEPDHKTQTPPAATVTAGSVEKQTDFTAKLFIDCAAGTYKNSESINPYGGCVCQFQILHHSEKSVNIKVVTEIIDKGGKVYQKDDDWFNQETSEWNSISVDILEPDLLDNGTVTFRFYVKETNALIGSISAPFSIDSSYYARTVNDDTTLTFIEGNGIVTTEKLNAETTLLIDHVEDGKAYFYKDEKLGYIALNDLKPAY